MIYDWHDLEQKHHIWLLFFPSELLQLIFLTNLATSPGSRKHQHLHAPWAIPVWAPKLWKPPKTPELIHVSAGRGYINACKIHVSIVEYSHFQRTVNRVIPKKFHKPKVKVLYLIRLFWGCGQKQIYVDECLHFRDLIFLVNSCIPIHRRVGLSSSRLSSRFPPNH